MRVGSSTNGQSRQQGSAVTQTVPAPETDAANRSSWRLPADVSPLAESMITGETLSAVLARWGDAFHRDFRTRLAAAGVAGDRIIDLRVNACGEIVSVDGMPGKPAIDAILSAGSDLCERYRKIADDASLLAASRLSRRYAAMADDAHLSGDQRRRLSEDLIVRIDRLEHLAGRMTDSDTGLSSAAVAFADSFGAPMC